ncbi:hypothetical protein [Ancylobacter lacus]|uniref:hypothetical protein n=1 Tax=Ancylobacter lacus TaxID=2579970 RepID=UPI001BD11D96|nr:hypothetical protein [Ancylobacter lacus]MBS7541266.1 hypothetical protein [Ancylobacter lacus]
MKTADRLTVLKSGGDILLAFAVRGLPPVDLEWRIRVACNLVRRAVEKVAGVEVEGHDGALLFRFEATDEASIHGLARRLEKRVATVLSTPLTPKAVDRTLGISSRERLRWYKDGRLPTCGRGRDRGWQSYGAVSLVSGQGNRVPRCQSADYRGMARAGQAGATADRDAGGAQFSNHSSVEFTI